LSCAHGLCPVYCLGTSNGAQPALGELVFEVAQEDAARGLLLLYPTYCLWPRGARMAGHNRGLP
jgi:hypothetical protein